MRTLKLHMKNRKIWIKCSNKNYYRILNRICDFDLGVTKIKKQKNMIYLEIEREQLNTYKKCLMNYNVKYVGESGIVSWLIFIKNNIFLFITILLGFGLLFVATNFIVDIEIIHQDNELRELISSELKENGIHVLSLKKDYKKLYSIRQQILDKYPDKIDWLEIETKGMKYIVHVEERIIVENIPQSMFCNIYATKPGLIEKIKLERGVAVVNEGDYVNEGALLITGNITYNDEIKSTVCAKGEIVAKTWYQVSISLPIKYNEYTRTGKYKFNVVYENEFGEKRLLKNRFKQYDNSRIVIFNLFGKKLYLERDYELSPRPQEYSLEQGEKRALELAEEKFKQKLSDKEKILDKKVLKKSLNNSTIEVVVFIVAQEVISS